MISAQMKTYDFYLIEGKDDYAQDLVSSSPIGQVRMCIDILSQGISDNPLLVNSNYIGLTQGVIDTDMLISFGDKLLKINYINPVGRYKQAFLGVYNG